MEPVKISCVVITFNEEKNIERCLRSVINVADEIVVLDSYSTDRTEEICSRYGTRFYQHAFDGHIEQKNRALTFASCPYILSLDADEALDDTLQASIRAIKNNFDCDSYMMNRLTNYCGTWIRHSGWYPDRKLRLWKAGKGAWSGMNPHDRLVMNDKSARTGFLKGDILHYSYYSVEEHYRQSEYFAGLAADAFIKSGKSTFPLQVFIAPAAKFIRNYIVKLGFLDGRLGFTIARISAWSTYLKYKKIRDLPVES